ALYVEKTETVGQVKVERDFRAFPPRHKLEITIEAGEPGDDWYEPKVVEKNTVRSNLDDVLAKGPVALQDIAKRLGKKPQVVERMVRKEMKAGRVGVRKGKSRGGRPPKMVYLK